jgi:ParB-like chromosome segregation protein Spo0J
VAWRRLEAARRLGLKTVPVVIHANDEPAARLWEIAENLHRADLTVLERSEHIAEWVRLTDGVSRQVDAKLSTRGRAREGRPESGVGQAD